MFKVLLLLTPLTVDITKLKKTTFFLHSFAVDAADTVDSSEMLFLKYVSKMFKDLLLLTLLTLLTTWESCFSNRLQKCLKTQCTLRRWHCWLKRIQKKTHFLFSSLLLLMLLTLLTAQKFCSWSMPQRCSKTYCCWQCWHYWQQGNLVFEICFKNFQRF